MSPLARKLVDVTRVCANEFTKGEYFEQIGLGVVVNSFVFIHCVGPIF